MTDTLNVLGLVDLHWSGHGTPRLPQLSGVDLVLLGGDLTHFRGTETARRLIEAIQAAGPRVLAVCGNCDRPEIEDYLAETGIALDRCAVAVGRVKFAGLSGGLPYGGCPYERTEEEFAEACAQLQRQVQALPAAGPTIVVSHQPAYATVCDFVRRRHVGSHAIRNLVKQLQPDLVFSGHIHEAIGTDQIGRTRLVNPGPWQSGHTMRFEIAAGQVGELRLEQSRSQSSPAR